MKTKLFLFFALLHFSLSYCQSIQINQLSATSVSGGININLQVSRVHLASFLIHNYTVNGTTINLSVCYFISPLTMQVNLNNNFLIPVPNNINYNINVQIVHSSSSTVCNNFSNGPTASTNFLNADNFELLKHNYALFPNPTKGKLAFKNNDNSINNISFFDLQGRKVKEITNFSKPEFDIFDLNNGVYMVKIENEKGLFSQKIILNR